MERVAKAIRMNIAANSFRPLKGSMREINRSLVMLKPKQAFLDWARKLDDEDKDLSLEELAEDSTGYLIPELWQDSDQQSLLESCYDVLFEEQLAGWWTDETAWPEKRNLKMFLDWFEVEFHSLVCDLCDEPIHVIENGEDTS
jgi:hypothetical protein